MTDLTNETAARNEASNREKVPGQRYLRSTDRPATLDLNTRWVDVRRVAKSHPAWRRCITAGWDPEDLCQEVLVRVLARQQMKSRYDPHRSCVSKYLFVVTGSILTNLSVSVRHLGSKNESLDAEGDIDRYAGGDDDDREGSEGVFEIPW